MNALVDPIYVTQPFLPPLEEFLPYLEDIWQRRVLTNCGPLHARLEEELAQFLGVKHVALFANATIALITALQALRINGEVITTPFSFVATSHSLLWNGLKPVFVDIDRRTLNIDPDRIETAITPQTTAIMPVHCYGHACDVDAIQQIADRYNLRVIYDAAHAFGVRDGGGSILRHGDMSILSFHATKVFNTFEGGAIICDDPKTKTRIDQLKNFGHAGEESVVAAGINGKMSEVNAAFGLLQLKHIDTAIAQRRLIDHEYRRLLQEVPGISCLPQGNESVGNFSYFPILIDRPYPLTRNELYSYLKKFNVHPRKYFYPLISSFPMYRGLASSRHDNLPVARAAAEQVLCLPIFPALSTRQVGFIVDIMKEAAANE